jgi:CHAT domain-containing protein
VFEVFFIFYLLHRQSQKVTLSSSESPKIPQVFSTGSPSSCLTDQFRVLHLAVHGFADTQYPERSALVLGTDPESGDDGLLQVREIIRLRLNAELTTLSACDTGVGKLQGQEGISNLVEAFLVAGSKSVVASLWSADDTSASALMEHFYQRLAQGENASSALRNAKLDLLAKYGDQLSPFYWAAFITVGETSAPIGIKQQ